MAEQDNIGIIQSLYGAFGRDDIQTILDRLAPDVEWIAFGPEIIPYCGKRLGAGQVADFFNALGSTQSNPQLTIDEYLAQDDRVASFGRYSGVVKATGKKFDTPIAHLFTLKDGKIAKFLDFFDTEDMARAYTSTSAAAS